MTKNSPSDPKNLSPLMQLRQQMIAAFNLEELENLCFDLDVRFDELYQLGFASKVRQLIQLMKRNDRLPDLHTTICQERPHIKWPDLANLQSDPLIITEALYPSIPYVINYYVTGTDLASQETYPYYFTVGIQNFLTHYLGTDQIPVAFGGREHQLEFLDKWLIKGETQRLLITAPAGRGKSALLVRWSQQLAFQDELAIVFIPISLRVNTNREDTTFVTLAARLSHFYGKQIPTNYANLPPQMWRGLVAEYLREPLPDGRYLVLILDGLDEAAWDVTSDLLPFDLPSTTRVIISARNLGGEDQSPAPWLSRLGWDRFPGTVDILELQNLTKEGVTDVLDKMGYPLDKLEHNIDLATELYRLSEGDPLLIELYVNDLWQWGEEATWLQPEDLQSIRPSYKGYFDKWWEEQERLWGRDNPLEKDLVNDILDLLAMALGPLTSSDLYQLFAEQVRSRDIKQAITPLNRFVIGDGNEQGYAFAHPKLGEYFRDQLEDKEQIDWQLRFIAWGRKTLLSLQTCQMNPLDVSKYLMMYYGRHLEETDASIEGFLELASWEWIQVWHNKTKTHILAFYKM